MNNYVKLLNRLNVLVLIMLISVCAASCGTDEDDEDALSQGGDKSTGKGSVTITNIEARKKTTTGLQIDVTVKASGVKADEVTALGVQGGTGKDAEGSLRASVGGGQISATLKIVSGLRAETTYYVKAYLKTKEGTVYSSVKKVTTP